MTQHVCEVCKKTFSADASGRRESDWIKSPRHCDVTCNLAATDIAEGRSIRWAALNDGRPDVAARRVRDVFSLAELKRALADAMHNA